MKQETLEEAAVNYVKSRFGLVRYPDIEQSFTDGAKYQADKMYSKEEVHKIIESYQNIMENNPIHTHYNKWFEQFKKK